MIIFYLKQNEFSSHAVENGSGIPFFSWRNFYRMFYGQQVARCCGPSLLKKVSVKRDNQVHNQNMISTKIVITSFRKKYDIYLLNSSAKFM